MFDERLPRAVTGTEKRLDALIARMDRVCDLLKPIQPPEPEPGDTVELREPAEPKAETEEPEPAKQAAPKRTTKKRSSKKPAAKEKSS